MGVNVPSGYRQTKVGVIPEDWDVVKLGDIATFYKGKGISKKDISEDGIPCIRYGELYTKYNEKIQDIFSKTNIDKEDLFLSQANDILIPASGETAIDLATASCVLKDNIGLGGDINIIRSSMNGIFLSYYLNVVAKINIASLAQGVSVIHLYSSQLKSLYIVNPPLKEQQKITQILSTWDNAISKQEDLIKAKEVLKKGLMQKLLSGEVRFAGFDGEWEEVKLGDIGKVVGGGTPSTENETYWNGDIFWFTPTEIKSKYITKSKRKITELGLKKSSAKLLPINTLLLTTRATIGDVSIAQMECTTNQGFQSIIVNNQNSFLYIYYWILQNKKELIRKSSGSTFIEISKKEIEKIPFLQPTLKEQQKIAQVLTTADKEIELLKKELETLKEQKRGLMQRLLSGIVRVKIDKGAGHD